MATIDEKTRAKLDRLAQGIEVDESSVLIIEVDGQDWRFYPEDGVTRYRLATDDEQP